MKTKHLFYLLGFISLLTACSNFEEQEFTVLLPNAGQDQVIFTEDTGTTIKLNATQSSDINNLGFEYKWTIISTPENFPITLSSANEGKPTFEVKNNVSGRYEFLVEIMRGDQVAKDFINVDINPAFAQILFVNAIDDTETSTFNIPSVNRIGEPVASQNTDASYINIDTNISKQADGTTVLEVVYNGQTLTANENLEALKSYMLYLVGTKENPELFLVEKLNNQNSIGFGLISLDYINLSQTDNTTLYIDVTGVRLAPVPIAFDLLLSTLGIPGSLGVLSYKENGELFFPSGQVLPLPIFSTVNGVKISNETVISLPDGVDANFGTFILFPDASATDGHTLKFINNSSLLPQ
tara:strand:- start:23723 stop:24781 length:1059 start_codon:yes stop_codon:yes gene_type:complete